MPANKTTRWVVASTIGIAGLVTLVFLVRFSPTLWEEYLILRLSVMDADAQEAAASALAERGVVRAIAPLLAAEENAVPGRSREESLRESTLVRAVRTICRKHKAEALAVLQPLYGDYTQHILSMASELGELSLPLLRMGLQEEAYLLRELAIMVAGELGRDASPLATDLARRLMRENHHVRRAAARALGRIGNARPEIILALKDCAAGTSDNVLKQAALESLESLERK